jgi:hypothetical protein
MECRIKPAMTRRKQAEGRQRMANIGAMRLRHSIEGFRAGEARPLMFQNIFWNRRWSANTRTSYRRYGRGSSLWEHPPLPPFLP